MRLRQNGQRQYRSISASTVRATQEWHNRTGDMLAYLNDVLHPHGFDEIVKDDFAALRQMLTKRRMG